MLTIIGPASPASAVSDPASLVDPLIGSSNSGETFPGAVTPFGMVQFSPENTYGNQNRTPEPGGYSYNFTRIRGFAMTHMSGTGCAGGFGDIPFFPHVGTVDTSPTSDTSDAKYASSFSHANETAQAGLYRVGLDSGVNVELSATARTGSARFTYPAGQTASLLVRTSNSEVGSSAAQTTINAASRTISGSVTSGNFCGYINAIGRRSYYTLYFSAVFDQPFAGTGTWQDGTLQPGSTSSSGATTYGTDGWPVAGRGSGGYVTFAPGQTVNMRVGISFVSQANAQANLQAENPAGTSFDTVRQLAHNAWNTELGRLDITGGTTGQQATFYTALYHSLLHPNIFSDVNGQYRGMDQQTHTVSGSQQAQYANFSGWDVYRSQLQLVTLLRPDVGADIAQSLFNQANQDGGVWDRWTHASGGTHVMTGDPAHATVPSIYAFGGTGFDAAGALSSMVSAATTVTQADLSNAGWNVMVIGERPSLDQWLSIHYIAANSNAWGGAGETLEDSVADFGISQLAGRLGQTSTQQQFLARAQYWRNVFNPNNGGYIQQRNANGTWPSFNPGSDDGFAEGSAAQYTWMIPHNVRGLFNAMGGNTTAASRLDNFFHNSDGSWALTGAGGLKAEMDNEPSIGAPWLYNFAGRPYQTQQTVRQIVNTLWSTGPSGIPGQDDLGAMSAWYVWAAMGLHPLTSGRAELLIASPLFPTIAMHRSNGVNITINAPGAASGVFYVQSLTVNGAASTKSWLPESFVANGGTMSFTLGTTANTSWGSAAADAPPSFDVVGNDFSISAAPGSGSVNPGGSVTSTVTSALTNGSAQTVSLSASGLPGGATASFNPSSISSAGGSSTLTIATSASTPAGTYTVTVTGTGTSATRTTTFTLTVNGTGGGCTVTNGNNVAIPDLSTVESTITISGCAGNAGSASTVEVHILHTWIGDLIVSLIAPDGTTYVLHNRAGGSADNINQTYTVNLSSEVANGTWRLRVQDAEAGDVGTIDSWTLSLGGSAPPGPCTASNPNDVQIPDLSTVNSPITISGCTGNASATSTVEVHIVHTFVGDLIVSLVAPDESVYLLRNQTGGDADNIDQTFTVNLSSEARNGAWNLRVQDAAQLDSGYINSWTLTL